MDAMERLRSEEYVRQVKEDALASSLTFMPWSNPRFARDMTPLRTTSETGGLTHAILFVQGKYDNWAAVVYRWLPDGTVYMAWPRDEFYFSRIALMALTHGNDKVYRMMESIYAMSGTAVSRDIIDEIGRLCDEGFGDDANLMFNMCMHVYYGMIAEEHYQRLRPDGTLQRTRLGKVMKMLALHRLLFDHVDVVSCAHESVGRDVKPILDEASTVGIIRHEPEMSYLSAYDEVQNMPAVTPYGDKKC